MSTMNDEERLNKSYRRMRAVLKSYGFTPVNDLLAQLYAACNDPSRDQQIALEARKNQTFKVIQGLVKTGAISDSAAAHSLAMHTTLLEFQPHKGVKDRE